VKKLVVILSSVLLLGAASVFIFGDVADSADSAATAETVAASETLVVYKSPTCGCCGDWVEHMKAAGFEVEVHDVDDVNAIKAQNGVDRRLASCHTALIGDYVIEGHVPAQDVKRLLEEKPAVLGLAVPGMPAGSPGMEMPDPSRHQDYQVVAFDGTGPTAVFREVKANSFE